MIEVVLPDGTVARFPAGTPPEKIRAALAKRLAPGGVAAPAVRDRQAAIDAMAAQRAGLADAPPKAAPGMLGTFADHALHGITFGGSDEAVAGLASLFPGMTYDQALQAYRDRLDAGRAANPWTATAGEVLGGAAGAIGGAGALGLKLAGKTLRGTMARSAGAGAGEGFLYGLLSGRGGLSDRAANAGTHAGLGAGIGFVAPAAVAAAGGALRAGADVVGGGLDAVLNRASEARAGRAVLESLQRSGKTLDEVAEDVARAARDGQPEFRLMDALGMPGQRRASGVVRSGGDGARELADFLMQRQTDQPNRVAAFADDAFGLRGRTAAQVKEDLAQARKDASDAAFGAVRRDSAPVDVRGVLDVIDARIGGMKDSGVKGDGIDAAFASIRSRLAAQPGGPAFPGADSVELSDFSRVFGVRQDVADMIGRAKANMEGNKARELIAVRNALDDALSAASRDYRAAMAQHSAMSRPIDALRAGAEMAAPSVRASDSTRRFAAMTAEEKAAARAGYGDRILAGIEANRAQTSNAARPFNSTKSRIEAEAMALDPGLLARRVARENVMWETQNRALGGPRTADNFQDIASVGAMANIVRAVRDAANLQLGQAATHLGSAVQPALTGQNAATRALIARMLMSDQPREVLQSAIRRKEIGSNAARKAEAVIRALGRQ